jgi:hypothetical protein
VPDASTCRLFRAMRRVPIIVRMNEVWLGPSWLDLT